MVLAFGIFSGSRQLHTKKMPTGGGLFEGRSRGKVYMCQRKEERIAVCCVTVLSELLCGVSEIYQRGFLRRGRQMEEE